MTWPWLFSSAHPPLPPTSDCPHFPPCPLLQALSVLPHLSTLAVPQCSRLVGAAIERLPSLVPELRWEGGHRWNTRAAVDAGLTKRRGGLDLYRYIYTGTYNWLYFSDTVHLPRLHSPPILSLLP